MSKHFCWTMISIAALLIMTLLVLSTRMLMEPERAWRYRQWFGGSGEPELGRYFRETTGHHLRVEPQLAEGSVLLFGDSHIQGMAVSEVAPRAVNFGIGMDTSRGLLMRLPYHPSREQAAAVIIEIGGNDWRWRDDAAIVANLRAALDLIPASVPVLLNAVLPVHAAQPQASVRNTRVSALNAQLSALCRQRQHCEFLDIQALFASADGSLSDAYSQRDGLHLNVFGYLRWTALLRESLCRHGVAGSCLRVSLP
ncbi:MAG: GDSL-type esterase/lipase family protein [Permianibacter sp.]